MLRGPIETYTHCPSHTSADVEHPLSINFASLGYLRHSLLQLRGGKLPQLAGSLHLCRPVIQCIAHVCVSVFCVNCDYVVCAVCAHVHVRLFAGATPTVTAESTTSGLSSVSNYVIIASQ